MNNSIDVNQPYWDMDIEPLFNTTAMHEIQNDLLLKNLPELYDKRPLIKKRMDEAGISPRDIKSLDDLQRIPVFGQPEMRDLMVELNFDLKKLLYMILGDESDDIAIMASTSGTTGVPTPYPVLRSSVLGKDSGNQRLLWRIGVRPGDIVVQAFGLSMFLAGVPMVLSMAKFPGITVIPVGAEAGTERILNFTKLFEGNVLTCTPSLALHMIEKAPEILGHGISSLGIKIILCGGEPGAGIPEVRKRIESEYNAKLFDAGAGFGVSCDYPEYQGMHWIADDTCYYELVNPETGKNVSLEDGNTGLGVFTSLTMDTGIIGVRQTLGDIHQVFTSPCPCGKSGFRYKVIGRTDDMLKIKGVMVYPAQIKNAVESMIPKTTGEFRILLDEPPPRVVPPLKIKIEFGKSMTAGDLPALTEEMEEKFHKMVKIRPMIEWVKPNTFERSEKKTQYIEKLYEK